MVRTQPVGISLVATTPTTIAVSLENPYSKSLPCIRFENLCIFGCHTLFRCHHSDPTLKTPVKPPFIVTAKNHDLCYPLDGSEAEKDALAGLATVYFFK
jgi:hypothetical protein